MDSVVPVKAGMTGLAAALRQFEMHTVCTVK